MKIKKLYEIDGKLGHKDTVKAWTFFREKDLLSSIVFFNDNIIEPGVTLEPHIHDDLEEIYYVLEGVGTIVCGDEQQNVEAGDAVYLPPQKMHFLSNTSKFPLRFVCVGARVAKK